MGASFSKNIVNNVSDYITGRKRKQPDSDDDEINKIIDVALHTPKRKKLATTAQYIYQVLFEQGANSDITVSALGEDFYLHKVYLCQSPYFASMFGGNWLESTKDYVRIDIIDPLITVQSLKVVFGSMYNYEVTLNPLEIIPILATATMFQLDGLIEKCTEVMVDTINPKTSVEYYRVACEYGNKKLHDACFRWFLANLMTYYFAQPLNDLKTISVDLMRKLIADPDLFVLQTEYSIYVMLKCWMYMLIHSEGKKKKPKKKKNRESAHDDENNDDEDNSDKSGCHDNEEEEEDVEEEEEEEEEEEVRRDVEGELPLTTKEINNFYTSRKDEVPFLCSDEGQNFISVFRGVRLHNLVNHKADLELVLQDNIIPSSWLNPVVLKQWKTVLKVNHNDDKGPCEVSDETFLRTNLRCGRILTDTERHMWRWTGFHFGMDLLLITDGRTLSLKRNHRPEYEQLLSQQATRYVAIRVTVAKLNEQRQIVFSQKSEIMKLSLAKSEEIQLMQFSKKLNLPFIISANILYTAPDQQDSVEQEEPVQTVS